MLEPRVRFEPHTDVKERSQRPRVERKQTLHDDDLTRFDRLVTVDSAAPVVVHRLLDRTAVREMPQVLLDLREVVRARIERGDADGVPLDAIEAQIAVEANLDAALVTENLAQPLAERDFAGAGIAAHRNHDRTYHAQLYRATTELSCGQVEKGIPFDPTQPAMRGRYVLDSHDCEYNGHP